MSLMQGWRLADGLRVWGDSSKAIVLEMRMRAFGYEGVRAGDVRPYVEWVAANVGSGGPPPCTDQEALSDWLLEELRKRGLAERI